MLLYAVCFVQECYLHNNYFIKLNTAAMYILLHVIAVVYMYIYYTYTIRILYVHPIAISFV